MEKKLKELVLESIEPVVFSSRYIKINTTRVREIAEKIKDYTLPGWDNDLQFLGTPEETAQYYFFVDSINFCFWGKKGTERWQFQKDGEWIGGYYAFSYAIKKAVENDKRLLNADFLSNLSLKEFSKIFEGKNELYLLPERHQIINENFRILKEKFGGEAKTLLEESNFD